MNKVAVISGGASGIGQSLAIEYAKAGVNTVVNYYPSDPHDVQQTVDAVERQALNVPQWQEMFRGPKMSTL